jgi:hypothetical protein
LYRCCCFGWHDCKCNWVLCWYVNNTHTKHNLNILIYLIFVYF